MTVEVAPHSMFGQHSYAKEQMIILQLTKEVDVTTALISPLTVEMPIPLQHLPANWRREKIKQHLGRAKVLLTELGL
jgi:hypothetical protein